MSNLTAHTNGHDTEPFAPDGRRYIEGKDLRPPSNGLEGGVQLAAFGLAILAVLLGLLGAGISFAKVADAVRPYFGALAPTVPLGIDIGIGVFTGVDLLMAHMGMRTRWLRLVPWMLIGATVFLNVADETAWVGRVAHGVLPLLWVIIVEVGAHIVRHRAGLTGRGKVKRDKIPFSRWLLSPGSTVRLWRWMILWGEKSYDAGLKRLQDMEITKVRLASLPSPDPEQVRLFKQGRLTPTDVRTTLGRPADVIPDVPALPPADERTKRPAGRPRKRSDGWSDEQWRTFARDLKKTFAEDGRKLSGYALRKAARERGQSIGNEKAERLVTDVLAEGASQ